MSDETTERRPPTMGISRRGFLKGSGVIAAAALEGVALGTREAAAQLKPAAVGPGATEVRLRVNGTLQAIRVEPRTTLAEALREALGLTGTKVACDRGACSACTVWLGGAPVTACMTLAIEVGDRAVTTIEGLAKGDRLHPVQAAFIEHDAAMCGFCTPGMVMACAALLERAPDPGLDDVKAAVSGNLCRCGTYPKVFAATLAAARAGRR
jgi:xanthine dehydrogenase YagT iron-sulfur-binding subunit